SALSIGISLSLATTLLSLRFVYSIVQDIDSLNEEIHSGLAEFRDLSDDAWTRIQSLSNVVSHSFLHPRSIRSVSVDICNCVNDSRKCPRGERGPPGYPGPRGENEPLDSTDGQEPPESFSLPHLILLGVAYSALPENPEPLENPELSEKEVFQERLALLELLDKTESVASKATMGIMERRE
ncbi:hypothetical protein PENTCL1PPCAC_6804, partial [Pristionchus entomophagus]